MDSDDGSSFGTDLSDGGFPPDAELPPLPPFPPRRFKTTLTPIHGAYVVFTLDPVATLESLEDPVATELARQIPRRKYVGCLAMNLDLPSRLRRYNKCTCIILSQGLPQASEEDGVEETMCIPINPAQHPTGRAGVTISPPLPWENLYHHSLLALELRLKPEDGDYSTSPLVSREDLWHLNMSFHDDNVRRQQLLRIYDPPPADVHSEPALTPALESMPISPVLAQPVERNADLGAISMAEPTAFDGLDTPFAEEHHPLGSSEVASMRNSHREDVSVMDDRSSSFSRPDTSESEDSEEIPPEQVLEMTFQKMIMGYEEPEDRFLPVAEFSLDMSTATEFCDARQLHADIETLEKIQHESEQRTRAHKKRLEQQRLEQWARSVSEHSLVQPTTFAESKPESDSTKASPIKPGRTCARLSAVWPRVKSRYTAVKQCIKAYFIRCARRPRPTRNQSNSSTMSRLWSNCTLGCISPAKKCLSSGSPASGQGSIEEKSSSRTSDTHALKRRVLSSVGWARRKVSVSSASPHGL
ncbi:hypothetical protein BV25DRAFT_1823077 [Artomyces pyxidatus]|uniref:Uncharacterized protein n=1 Tax=Artomyces pyxidatus TaxID=48021 RepID=A0ACB8T920_9AGAM|nr:hypothetical protein BV25DRAFT_1823077 [Artomyces pyxidatus]